MPSGTRNARKGELADQADLSDADVSDLSDMSDTDIHGGGPSIKGWLSSLYPNSLFLLPFDYSILILSCWVSFIVMVFGKIMERNNAIGQKNTWRWFGSIIATIL